MFRKWLVAWAAVALTQLQGLQVQSDLVQIYNVTPGQVIQGQVKLFNQTEKPENIEIFVRDYRTKLYGVTENDPIGTSARSNGNWIKLTQPELILNPQTDFLYTFSIHVPEHVDPGTYWSMIFIAPKFDPSLKGVQQRVAYAIQTITRREPLPDGNIKVLGLEVINRDNHRYAVFNLRNTSIVDMYLHSNLEVYNTTGELVKKVSGDSQRLYPDNELSYQFDISDLPPGHYQAMGIFDDQERNYFGIQKELHVE